MYRGVILSALVHDTMLEVQGNSVIEALCGPGLGLVFTLVLCAKLGLAQAFRRQCNDDTWESGGIDSGLFVIVTLGGMVAWVILSGAEKALTANQVCATLTQSISFAEMHRRAGLPPGLQGVAMLFVWATALGFLKLRTGGLFLVFVAHVWGDATIGVLLLIGKIFNLR